MTDRLIEARERYDLALVELGNLPPTEAGDWPIDVWVRAEWNLMRAQALEGLDRLDRLEVRAEVGSHCPAHGEHPHHGLICLDCPQCATGTATTRDV